MPKANKNKRKRAEIDLCDQKKDSLDKRVTRCQIKKTKKLIFYLLIRLNN